MQQNLPPVSQTPAPPRPRFGLLLALSVLVAIAVAAVGGYLLGASGIGHATLRVQVTNNLSQNVTASVTVNGVLAGTLPIAAGRTGTVDVPVAFATSNGGAFDVQASASTGPRDSSSVFVNMPGIFIVSLTIG